MLSWPVAIIRAECDFFARFWPCLVLYKQPSSLSRFTQRNSQISDSLSSVLASRQSGGSVARSDKWPAGLNLLKACRLEATTRRDEEKWSNGHEHALLPSICLSDCFFSSSGALLFSPLTVSLFGQLGKRFFSFKGFIQVALVGHRWIEMVGQQETVGGRVTPD